MHSCLCNLLDDTGYMKYTPNLVAQPVVPVPETFAKSQHMHIHFQSVYLDCRSLRKLSCIRRDYLTLDVESNTPDSATIEQCRI